MSVESERSVASASEVSAAVLRLADMQRWVTLSSGRTRYFEDGLGPPLLLLHGIGLTAGGTNWLLNISELAIAGYRVIAPDFIGFGPGSRLMQPYSFAYLVDFVREFLEALDVEACDVVGHSMGGWVASLLAYESPERVRRLVLIGAGGMAIGVPRSMQVEMPRREDFAAEVSARLGLPVNAVEALADLEWEITNIPGVVEAYGRLLSHMADPETRHRYHLRRRLPRVRADTLVLWGADDQVNQLSLGRAMAEALPRARLEVVSCGHAVPTEAAADTNAAIRRFFGEKSIAKRESGAV